MRDGPSPGAPEKSGRTLIGRDGPPIQIGVERLLHDSGSHPTGLKSATAVGLVTSDGAQVISNPGSTAGGPEVLAPTRQLLLQAGVPLTRLFTPEHGLSARAPDGQRVEDGQDELTNLPVTSLYGPRLAPAADDLRDLDLVLFDLQDVGVRFYTFLWTLSYLMEACGEAGIPLLVLDRPNPLGGLPEWVEGPLPDPDSPSTNLSRWPIPIRHSLTLGEMALLLREEMALDVELDVVAMEGWRRDWLWPDTGLPFHPPSPGLPTLEGVLLYPGLAFLEATNVHEGRGTHLAFHWFGAPWMDGDMASDGVNQLGITSIDAQPCSLLRQGNSCPGVLLEVTDSRALRSVSMGLRLLSLLGTLWPEAFRWSPYPTAANPTGQDHLVRLLGSRGTVRLLEDNPQKLTEAQFMKLTEAPGWWARAEPHLLYP